MDSVELSFKFHFLIKGMIVRSLISCVLFGAAFALLSTSVERLSAESLPAVGNACIDNGCIATGAGCLKGPIAPLFSKCTCDPTGPGSPYANVCIVHW